MTEHHQTPPPAEIPPRGPGADPLRDDPAGERGSLAVLLLGFVAIVLGLLLVGVDATAGQLARLETLNAADAAARDAADELSEESYYGTGPHRLDPAVADTRARGSLARQVPSSRVRSWQVDRTTVEADGVTATVHLSARIDFPVTGFVRAHLLGDPVIRVTSSARGTQG
ncbi:hypothetical protein SAMN05445756_1699 [Kytococcus aerolatus]|uniref:Putative Flp pilus-assembly TadG-like N-terminal domain-containing protein n=1 Tax=Kytococcus aerolatus TaxID=592308 RepID=A0A212U1M8_9MICO|nr:pilus assembly protein TadG-related protein [Kytococcus aerolatus]SNC72031.1 hypothetical protein SAMN05445756_1699 [Kytococcus aerolatus]